MQRNFPINRQAMIAATGLGISSVSISATISTRQKIAWGAAVRRGGVALLDRHVEYHKIAPFLPELAYQLPVTDNEEDIAQQDRLIHHRPFHRHAIALQPTTFRP